MNTSTRFMSTFFALSLYLDTPNILTILLGLLAWIGDISLNETHPAWPSFTHSLLGQYL